MQILVLRSVNQSVLAFPSCYKCKSTSQNFMSGPILTAAPRTFKTNLWFSNNLTEFQNTSSQFHVPDYSTLKHKGSNFCPPRIPKRVNQLNLSIFAELPQSGGELSVNATKTGKIGHRQSIPLSLTGLLSQPIHCCRTIHITTIHLDTIHLEATIRTH